MARNVTNITNPETGLRGQIKSERRSRVGGTSRCADPKKGNHSGRNDRIPDMKFEHRKVCELKFPDRLVRNCNAEHVKEIAQGIRYYGWCDPVLINGDGHVIDGAARIRAAEVSGLDTVPCIVVDHLTPSQRRALRLALNRLQEKGSWHLEELKFEFLDLIELDVPLEFTGFETGEIDVVLEEHLVIGDGLVADDEDDAGTSAEETLPTIDPNAPVVSEPGDLWQLGKHRLLCGSALDQKNFTRLLDGKTAAAVFTDPPFNVRIANNVCGKGKIQHP